jgi:hypothetical protein
MKRFALLLCLLGLAPVFSSAPAGAQVSRTWVAGVGNDMNPCSRTAPCATLATALAATVAGGEINVLDPGGFQPVTINKSVSIYAGVGEAGILVFGTNAIVINAGATDVINLRGLTLNGSGGSLGVHILSAGRVSIQDCVIQQFGTGVNVATSADIRLKIQNSTIINNTNGVSVVPNSNIANVAIEHSHIDSNSGIGVQASGAFGGTTYVAVADSSVSLNGTNGVVAKAGSSALAAVSLMRDNFVGNLQSGVVADGTAGNLAFVRVGDSLFAHNLNGAVQAVAGGVLQSFGTNEIIGTVGSGFTGTAARQ